MADQQPRLRSIRVHDDGVDRWRMAAIAPPAALAGLIYGYSDYTEQTGSFTTRRELPHAQGVLIVNLAAPVQVIGGDGREIALGAGDAFVAGAHLRPAFSRSAGAQAGVHVFLPLASLRRLLGMPMDLMIDRVLPLNSALGREALNFCHALVEARSMDERIALLDAALIARFAATTAIPQAQSHALSMLRDRPELDISGVARAVGWSRKHLANRLHDVVGVGPRSWRRLLRFERLTARVANTAVADWAEIAHGAGYCDQSHMIREFREFSSITPGQYLAQSLPDGGGLIEG